MKKKHFAYIILFGIIVFISIPILHLVKTYLSEDKTKIHTPKGYTNDASRLDLTSVDSIVNVPTTKTEMINQLREIIQYSTLKHIPISIAGAKHSMGGHTMYPNGIILNMRPYKNMQLDTINNVLTIGSGALWEDAINYLDSFHKSVAVMQAFSSFSIGGSISVNGHGWQKTSPPISSSVVSFSLMNCKGEILNCSRTENKELFSLVLGGYGLFGIILDVKLKVVDNENLQFKLYKLKATEYLSYFKKYASDDKNVKLVFGRLNISEKNFLENATLDVFRTSTIAQQKKITKPNHTLTEVKRLVFRNSVKSEYGKKLRWDLETAMGGFANNDCFSRNEILNDNVALIENKDTSSTDILHEYFIPERHFNEYIAALKNVLPSKSIDLLNITIRGVYKDTDSYMRYANENVFGFVFLFNQKKTAAQEVEMKRLTQQLAEMAVRMEGTYYLPYRLQIDKKTFRKSYPQSEGFFKLKLKYDPHEVFKNKFYDYYK